MAAGAFPRTGGGPVCRAAAEPIAPCAYGISEPSSAASFAPNHRTAPAPGVVPSVNVKTPRVGKVSRSRPTSSTNSPAPTDGAGSTTRSTVNPASRPRSISVRGPASRIALTPPCRKTASPVSVGVSTPNSTSSSSPFSRLISQLVACRATVRPLRRGSSAATRRTIPSSAVMVRPAIDAGVTGSTDRWATTTTTPPALATRCAPGRTSICLFKGTCHLGIANDGTAPAAARSR